MGNGRILTSTTNFIRSLLHYRSVALPHLAVCLNKAQTDQSSAAN